MSQDALATELPAVLQQAENLPSLPAVALEVLRLTQSDETTLDDLASTLAMDPALSAKLLRLSNSSAFSMGSEVTTLQRACMVLGLKTVKLMALSFSLAGTFREGDAGAFDYDQFWRRSAICAAAGRFIAGRTNRSVADEAFLCGLLARIGQLVAARCMPRPYGRLVEAVAPRWPSSEQEEEALGFNGEDVVVALMQSWSMPSAFALALAHRRDPSGLPEDADEHVVALCRASALAWACEEFLCGADKAGAKERLDRFALEHFGYDGDAVEELLVELQGEIAETGRLLDVDVGKLDVAGMIAQAQSQLVQVSLGVAIENKQAERERTILTTKNKELADKAHTDKLTGLPNRARFDELMAACVQERVAGTADKALGLLMMDVDRFKLFNDTHGHQTGDEVLRMVGRVLARVTRDTDVACRYGGEEFAVVMPRTNMEGLRSLGERLRAAIERESLEYDGKTLKVTVSVGGACVERLADESGGALLVKAADHYLYQAKKAGRNRCAFHPRPRLGRS